MRTSGKCGSCQQEADPQCKLHSMQSASLLQVLAQCRTQACKVKMTENRDPALATQEQFGLMSTSSWESSTSLTRLKRSCCVGFART